jgi:DNA-binding CsgD family transcriptional regulator
MDELMSDTLFSEAECRGIFGLLGNISGMTDPIPARRQALLKGLAELINADNWLWVHSRGATQGERPAVYAMVDGGWASEAERESVLLLGMTDPKHPQPWVKSISEQLNIHKKHLTWRLQDILGDAEWKASYHYKNYYEPQGIHTNIMSVYPLGPDTMSAIAFHRKTNTELYTSRERAIVHLVTSEIDWLHRDGMDLPVVSGLRDLTSRERQVLTGLLSGKSRKEIASLLKLSLHTVNDHIKSIHAHFNVNSRGKLMHLFSTGGTS